MKSKIIILILTLSALLLTNCKSLNSLQNESENYNIIYESKGDINLDGITDLAIISSNSNSENGIITVLIADSKGNVTRELVNKNLTDEFIELYNQLPEIKIENGELTISYYGGMCHREFRNFIFKFNVELNDLFFKTFTIREHNVCNHNDPTDSEITNAKLRKIKLILSITH